MKHKRLHFDLETSQIIFKGWRTGKQYVGGHQILEPTKIISVHWKWEGDSEVQNMDWGLKKQCDKKLLEKFIPIMNQADEIVGHNGDRFDIKWVRTRAMFHGIPMNHTYNSIDTLKLAKKYLNAHSNSLKELCKYFGLELKKDPGGIGTWDAIQFDKSREALDHLLYYGDGDIVSLEALFNKLLPYVKPNLHYGVLRGGSKWSCPHCGGDKIHKNQTYTTAAGTIQHYMRCSNKQCDGFQGTYKINNKTYQDWLQYKMINNIK